MLEGSDFPSPLKSSKNGNGSLASIRKTRGHIATDRWANLDYEVWGIHSIFVFLHANKATSLSHNNFAQSMSKREMMLHITISSNGSAHCWMPGWHHLAHTDRSCPDHDIFHPWVMGAFFVTPTPFKLGWDRCCFLFLDQLLFVLVFVTFHL